MKCLFTVYLDIADLIGNILFYSTTKPFYFAPRFNTPSSVSSTQVQKKVTITLSISSTEHYVRVKKSWLWCRIRAITRFTQAETAEGNFPAKQFSKAWLTTATYQLGGCIRWLFQVNSISLITRALIVDRRECWNGPLGRSASTTYSFQRGVHDKLQVRILR